MSQGDLLTEADLRAEVKRLRHEVSQKQKRENKFERDADFYRRKAHRLDIELEAARTIARSLCLPRAELAEVGRELLRTFGEIE